MIAAGVHRVREVPVCSDTGVWRSVSEINSDATESLGDFSGKIPFHYIWHIQAQIKGHDDSQLLRNILGILESLSD